MNTYNRLFWATHACIASMDTCATNHRRTDTLALLQKAVAFEGEVNIPGRNLVQTVALSERITSSLKSTSEKFEAYAKWQTALRSCFDQITTLYTEAIEDAKLIHEALHTFRFDHYPWPLQVYNTLLWPLLNEANRLQCSAQGVASSLDTDDTIIARGKIAIDNLRNFQEWAYSYTTKDAINSLKTQTDALYPHLEAIFTHHAYMTELLPFILKVATLESEVQRSWDQSQERHVDLSNTVRTFLRTYSTHMLNWCTFWSDWNKHCMRAEELYAQAGHLATQLSGASDTHYQDAYALWQRLAEYCRLARHGSAVVENNVKFNNLLNYIAIPTTNMV